MGYQDGPAVLYQISHGPQANHSISPSVIYCHIFLLLSFRTSIIFSPKENGFLPPRPWALPFFTQIPILRSWPWPKLCVPSTAMLQFLEDTLAFSVTHGKPHVMVWLCRPPPQPSEWAGSQLLCCCPVNSSCPPTLDVVVNPHLPHGVFMSSKWDKTCQVLAQHLPYSKCQWNGGELWWTVKMPSPEVRKPASLPFFSTVTLCKTRDFWN